MHSFVTAVAKAGGWVLIWLQLPLLVLAIAVLAGVVIALLRAKPEDVPWVFGTLTGSLAHWPEWYRRRGNTTAGTPSSTTETEDAMDAEDYEEMP
ncbi:hypothetical protein [Nocardia xishanensis]